MASGVDELGTRVAVLETRVDGQERDFSEHNRKQNGSMEKIWDVLDEIQRNLNGRPTWGVATLITALVALVSAFITKAALGG